MKIQQIGEHQRFVVVNDDGCYWSGPCPGWVSELRSARVFAHREEAENVVRILDQQEKEIAGLRVLQRERPGRCWSAGSVPHTGGTVARNHPVACH